MASGREDELLAGVLRRIERFGTVVSLKRRTSKPAVDLEARLVGWKEPEG